MRIDGEIIASDDVALRLEAARMFSSGLELEFHAVGRAPSHDPRTGPSLLGGGIRRDDAFWLGVQLADGRKSTSVGGRPPPAHMPADAITLSRTHGSGHGNAASFSYFVAPVPPPGPVTIVLAWPAFGIGEAKIVLPSDAIADATRRIVTLWPLQDEDGERPPEPHHNNPPPGWFEQNSPTDGQT